MASFLHTAQVYNAARAFSACDLLLPFCAYRRLAECFPRDVLFLLYFSLAMVVSDFHFTILPHNHSYDFLGRPLVPPPSQLVMHSKPVLSHFVSSTPQRTIREEKPKNEVPMCTCCQNNAKAMLPVDDNPPPMQGGQLKDKNAPHGLLRLGVLTVSDRASTGEYKDRGGPAVLRCVADLISTPWVAEYRIVPDTQSLIESALCDMTDRLQCDLVITTGGTGPAPRDVTPEATRVVITRELPGFGEQMREVSKQFVSTAALSRQTAGIRRNSLILNLPGSPRAAHQLLPPMMEPIVNCLHLIGGPNVDFAIPTDKGVTEPVVSIKEDSNVKQRETFTIDALNLAWLDKIKEKFQSQNSSDPHTSIIRAVIQEARQHDNVHIFEKVRGCGRKKVKVSFDVILSEQDDIYILEAVEKHNLPDKGKAIRILIDFFMEELNDEKNLNRVFQQ
eukprot:m.241567 g.241567  ORF g.241567 m.241567 type:complete len:447 (+) comp16088_c0_seq23:1206-2546(+)